MKRILLYCWLCLFAVCFLFNTPIAMSAQRFSGGRSLGNHYRPSFGTSSSRGSYGQQRPTAGPQPTAYTHTNTGTPPPQPTRNGTHWALPALGGFAAGLGTAAVVSHLSQPNPNTASTTTNATPVQNPAANNATAQPYPGAPIAQPNKPTNFLPIIVLIVIIVAAFFWMRRSLNKTTATPTRSVEDNTIHQPMTTPPGSTNPERSTRYETLLGQSEAAFLDHSKTLFRAVQQAFDQRDKAQLEQLVTRDIFEEMEADMNRQPDGEVNITMLQATLRNVVEENHTVIASVYFHGLIREEERTNPLSEIWHLSRQANQQWIVDGISQEPTSAT